MRMQALCLVLTGSLLACDPSPTAAELTPRPQVGERLPGPFNSLSVVDAAKPDLSGKRWDFVERYGADPVVLVLARTDSDALTTLLKKIDAEVARHKMGNKKVHALLVMLTDDDDREEKLKEFGEKHQFKHVSLSVDSAAGPPEWSLAKESDVTVILYNRRKVAANHALRRGELDDKAMDKIIADFPKIVGK